MKRVVDTIEVLGTLDQPGGACEVCATAQAEYDDPSGRLTVRTQAFLRPCDLLVKEKHFRTDWLPTNETITESVAPEETHDAARSIFHHWVRKVRDAAPELRHV